VPAIEHPFTDFPPSLLYPDTDFLINCLVRSQSYHGACVTFLEHVIACGVTTIALSTFTRLEFAHSVTQAKFRNLLEPAEQQRLDLAHWDRRSVRENYLREFLLAVDDLLGPLDVNEIALVPSIQAQAINYMAQYNLQGQDALYLATALSVGIRDIASFDQIFRRIDGLHLWNNRIFG